VCAGAFSIQRLEGSRFGAVGLWVLNYGEEGKGWDSSELIVCWRRNQDSRDGFPQLFTEEVGGAGADMALVFRKVLKS
jgi:hypothetical protein